MRPETRDRRRATWKLLEIDGVSEAEATSTITAEYDVAESTVREDINNIDRMVAGGESVGTCCRTFAGI